MSKLQRLVLNHKDGTSEFIIKDGNAPAFDEAQNKTDEEKAQARENIGTDTLIVTFDEENYMASHTSQQIYDHVRNGGDAYWQNGTMDIALTLCEGNYCLFTHISGEEGYIEQLCVYEDGTGEEFTFTFAPSAFLNNKITAPSTAQVGQTIVVKTVDSNGKPTAWEAVDLPSGGIVVAKFYSYDDIRISCSTHTAEQLYNILNDDEMPVIAYVYDEDRGKNITAVCWTKGDSQICVGEPFGENGWMFDLANYNQSNFVNEQPDHTIGNELWCEM